MRQIVIHVTLMCGLALGLSCGKKSSSSSSSAASTAKTDAQMTAAITTGINNAAHAVQSSGVVMVPTPTTFTGNVGLTVNFPITVYPDECDEDKSGWPVGFGAESGSQGGSFEYNRAFLGCLLKQPDMRGETVIGALASIVSFACAVGDQLQFDGVEHTLTLPLTTGCYTTKYSAMLQSLAGGTTLSAKVTASTTSFDVNTTGKWDGSIRFKFSVPYQGSTLSSDNIYLFKLDEENKVYSFATTYGPDADKVMTWPYAFGWALTADLKTGTLRYEGRQQELNLEGGSVAEAKTRHTRAILTGTMSELGSFTNLSDAQLLTLNTGADSAGTIISAAFKSVKGNSTDGMYMKTVENTSGTDMTKIAGYAVGQQGCITTGASCTGNTGMSFAADADLDFLLISATTTALKTWFTNVVPLTFTAVTTADYQY